MATEKKLWQYSSIIVEALKDYRSWWDETNEFWCKEKIEHIDDALDFIQNVAPPTHPARSRPRPRVLQ